MAATGFSSLPERAKTLIYKLALPDDEPEVCIVWPLVIEAEHLCMTMRGVRKAGARTITSAVRGQMHRPATRAEAMSLIQAR